MRPDRVGALGAATGLLALTGVDRLEVVDVAVGLGEDAVVVVVVAVDLVELRQVGLDLLRRLAGRDLGVVPGGGGVSDERPVDRGVREVVRAVARLVVGHLDPVGHVALGREASVGLLGVEVLERLTATEHQVLEVGAVEVRHPVGRVVVRRVAVPGAVGSRDLVVDGAGRAAGRSD